jgi:hypothetical protein
LGIQQLKIARHSSFQLGRAPYEAASLHEPPDLGVLHDSVRDVAMVCRRTGNVMTLEHENEMKDEYPCGIAQRFHSALLWLKSTAYKDHV